MTVPTTLQELFPTSWGEDQPKTLVDLVNAKYDDLNLTAQSLRKMAINLAHSFEREPVHTARVARELLEKHHIPVRSGYWTALVLDENRERVYVRRKGSGMRLLHSISAHFPSADKLDEQAPLPLKGTYLLIYGGGLEILSEENLRHYETLISRAEVVDVLLWDNDDDAATFWSLQAGKGSRGSSLVDLPETNTVRRWLSTCQR